MRKSNQNSKTGTKIGRSESRDVEARSQLSHVNISELAVDPTNPRRHSPEQVRAIARSISSFGFNAPILIDGNYKIIAGHGRYEAAKLLGLADLPVIFLRHLSKVQATAYMLAENQLSDRSAWDDTKVAIHLKELSELVLDFDIEAIGFELPDIDFRIQSLDPPEEITSADEFDVQTGIPTNRDGDLWMLDGHRLYCGSALDPAAFRTLFDESEKAAAVFTDPPYNVKIDGHVSGKGSIKHREFAMAAGDMSRDKFAEFLIQTFELIKLNTAVGGLIYACMDYLPTKSQDDYTNFMQGKNFPLNAVQKDISEVSSQLRKRRVRFSGSIELSAPPESFKDLITMETVAADGAAPGQPIQWTIITIKDRIQTQE